MRVKDTQLTNEQIKDIIALYKLGTPKLTIAKQFGRHHSTIIYHIRRQEEQEGKAFIVKRVVPRNLHPVSEPKKVFVFKRAKSYSEYAEEDEARLIERQAKCEHVSVIRTVRCKCCGKVDTEVYIAK